ncbi:hypothetical protein ACFYXS_19085 [Streptomyces sp. NPDC002574]|uniref:hypothetical protein n=1 Tax=Streptomyces sp. NPDC002574 TaxID=3364652 RepID=UPI0036803C2C
MTALVLGPLEYIAGEWIIGDATAREGKHLRFQQQGLSHRVKGAEVQIVPWSRLMDLRLSAQAGRRGNSRALAAFTDLALALTGASRHGGAEACLAATLRKPYEDWVAHFSHPPRKYRTSEIRQAEALLEQTVECGRAAQLGEPRWMAETVGKIAGLMVGSRDMKAAIGEIVRG